MILVLDARVRLSNMFCHCKCSHMSASSFVQILLIVLRKNLLAHMQIENFCSIDTLMPSFYVVNQKEGVQRKWSFPLFQTTSYCTIIIQNRSCTLQAFIVLLVTFQYFSAFVVQKNGKCNCIKFCVLFNVGFYPEISSISAAQTRPSLETIVNRPCRQIMLPLLIFTVRQMCFLKVLHRRYVPYFRAHLLQP